MRVKEVLLDMYTAYVLDEASRQELAEQFPPKYDNFIGHHVTVDFGVPADAEAPKPASLKVIGHVDSGDGLEALVVSVNGNKNRPDGSTYHITWSIDSNSNYKPKDSNTLIADKKFTLIRPVAISTEPAVLK